MTDYQVKVLAAVSVGKRFKQIARDLGRSESGVRKALDRARRELGASSAPHAVAIAMRRGMIK